ncbi:MAG: beta-propeller fold lactonase family protein [Acidobacteriaceae bacterium]|nr:beta-propeller fold lactonase family protein [Acidobacteriaceae bacterium]
MARTWRKVAERLAGVAVLGALPVMIGCGPFFECEGKTSCGSSDSTTSSDIVLASNSSTGSTYINSWTLSSGALTAVSGSPFLLSFAPTAMVVSEANGYLFVASPAGTIYSYALSSAGVPSNGTAQAVTGYPEASMDISSDGKWLFAVDNATATAPALRVYSISSSGVLSAVTSYALTNKTGYTISPKSVRVSPNNDYVAVAMGAGGEDILAFDTSDGSFSTITWLNTASAADGDNAIAWDNNDNLYVARTTSSTSTVYSVLIYNMSKGAFTTSIPSSYTTGTAPSAMAFVDDYKYLYVANKSDSTISSFSQASGVLTQLGSTNTSAPTSVSSLSSDKSGDYLLAAGYDSSSGIQVFSVGSSGILAVQPTTAATGTTTSVPALVVSTH